MTYQFLALDLDGTILQDDHQLNPWVKEAIHHIKQQYPVMIVTGRHHTAAKPYYDELELNTPIICCNGVYRYHYATHEVEREQVIPSELASQFLSLAASYRLNMVMYTNKGMAFSAIEPIPYMLPLLDWAKQYPLHQQPNIYQVRSFEQELKHSQKIWKFVVQGQPANFSAFLEQPLIQQHFSGTHSGEHRIDLAMKGHSKGQALSDYIQSQNIEMAQVVAVGDNFNDVSMLTVAGCGIAMQQADEAVKNQANVICSTDNNGKGLSQWLMSHFLTG